MMAEIDIFLPYVPALGVIVALLYYSFTLRNTEKIRRKDFIFQSDIARDSEWFEIYFKILDMWDYDTMDEFNKKYSDDKKWGFLFIQSKYNTIGVQMMEGIAAPDEVLKLYPPHLVVSLFEMAWPWIRDMRTYTTNFEYLKGFECLYVESKKRLPNYVPAWQKGLRSTRAVHP
jgi:hypothetical protein